MVNGTSMADECNICGGDNIYANCTNSSWLADNGSCGTMDCDGVCNGEAQYLTYYYDNDGDGLGAGGGLFDLCSADVDNPNMVPNADDEDDNCFSNLYEGEYTVDPGDGSGDCCAGNSCIPSLVSTSGGSISLHPDTLDLVFNHPLNAASISGVEVVSTLGYSVTQNVSVVNENLNIALSGMTSRDTLAIT